MTERDIPHPGPEANLWEVTIYGLMMAQRNLLDHYSYDRHRLPLEYGDIADEIEKFGQEEAEKLSYAIYLVGKFGMGKEEDNGIPQK